MNKQWVTDNEDAAYELTNLKLTDNGSPLRLTVPNLTDEELSSWTDGDVPVEDARLAYYRQQVILCANIRYDITYHSKYSQKLLKLYDSIIEANNALTEQPYHYGFDDGTIPLTEQYVDVSVPTDWIAVLPGAAVEVLDLMEAPDRDSILRQLIYNYLIKTMPVTIKPVVIK